MGGRGSRRAAAPPILHHVLSVQETQTPHLSVIPHAATYPGGRHGRSLRFSHHSDNNEANREITMAVKYWLMKTEPGTYSIDDLEQESDQTTCWEGVRNYQARNLLRDEIQEGDKVLFYHSACKEPAVVGTAVVSRAGYPDHFQHDKRSKYYDAKSDPENPRWYMVDIKLDQKFDQPVTLASLREKASLKGMVLLQKGSRLSVQPVKKTEYTAILKMAGVS